MVKGRLRTLGESARCAASNRAPLRPRKNVEQEGFEPSTPSQKNQVNQRIFYLECFPMWLFWYSLPLRGANYSG
jgi:hypothetical protein